MAEAETKLDDFFSRVISVIGKTSEREVAELLKKSGQKIAVAESLTGGLISQSLTNLPGSSEYFVGGIVCYTNRVKVMQLGVPAQTISKYGEVSSEVALALAEGIKKKFFVDIGLAATGVAGPATVTPPRPVGLTYVAISSEAGTEFKELNLQGDRDEIRRKAAQAALGLLWMHLGGKIV